MQAFPGAERRFGHRARFPRPGHAQRHEEELQQKGRSLAGPTSLGGAGGWQPGRLEEGADLAGTLQRSVNTCLLQSRCQTLAPGIQSGIFRHKKPWHTLYDRAATCGDWAFQVTRVMFFIKSQTQQAVNAAAADSARCWRQWAKEACQGSAGAAHGFSKVGLDDGEVGGLAGPELLVKQMGTWLPLWLDSRRVNAKQLADQEDCGRAFCQDLHSKRSTMCARHRRAPLDWVTTASTPRLSLQLPVELASTVHRFAQGLRGKAGQTFVLVSHDGFEAQAIRRSSHNWPHGCPVTCAVSLAQATGAKVGERA